MSEISCLPRGDWDVGQRMSDSPEITEETQACVSWILCWPATEAILPLCHVHLHSM